MKKIIGTIVVHTMLALGLAVVPSELHAQNPGDKSVYGSSVPTNSHSYIDASVFITPGGSSIDICNALGTAIAQLNNSSYTYKNNGLIDARGIFPASSGGSLACSSNPWSQNTNNGYITVLLPAAKITGITAGTWQLPSGTRLIGEGSGLTTLSFSGSGDMIDMGNSSCSPNCRGISIEHLALVGAVSMNGIVNTNSQELNYVDDVSISGISGTCSNLPCTGIKISGINDNNSGPYTDIYYSGTGPCVTITSSGGLRAINGLTCQNTGSSPASYAIQLDGTNNTIQNITLNSNGTGSGYTDGILIGPAQVGDPNSGQNSFVFNVNGSSSVTNVVHIVNNSSPPTNVTLMGISGGHTAIEDDISNITAGLNSAVSLYILGEPVYGTVSGTQTQIGYSRFTTDSGAPAWYFSASAPSGTCIGYAKGSLYSVIAQITAPGTTLWGCVGGQWTPLSGSN